MHATLAISACTGKALFLFGCLDDLTKTHPLTSPITFGKDVESLPHAKVSSDTISRHVQAEYRIPLCKSVHFFRGFLHKTKIFFTKSWRNLFQIWRSTRRSKELSIYGCVPRLVNQVT